MSLSASWNASLTCYGVASHPLFVSQIIIIRQLMHVLGPTLVISHKDGITEFCIVMTLRLGGRGLAGLDLAQFKGLLHDGVLCTGRGQRGKVTVEMVEKTERGEEGRTTEVPYRRTLGVNDGAENGTDGRKEENDTN